MSITRDGDTLRLEGALTMGTVSALLAQARQVCDTGVRALDFGAATEVDSAALALALELRRMASTDAGQLQLLNVPEGMRKLIGLYGVEQILGV